MGLRQSMRPRHQVLVFRCYPRYQKSTTEVKPNSSELSYLLYYASTRRSKLQKVGEFLDHRTQVDVRKAKLGNIQVTLQIVTALIEKCPRDLPLYATSLFNILSTLLNSGDVNFVEESVQAFAAFCGFHDPASMSADPDHTRRYDEIVRTYSSFASKRTPTPGKSRGSSVPESLRFRTAGLKAIKALVSSESFAADDKHIKVVMPSILENLWSQKPGHFRLIERRENADEQHEKELSLRRRQSMSAQRSTEIQRTVDLNETDPSVASVSTADVDRRANEEAGVLAMKSLRSIFAVDNRGQIRMASTAALNFAVKQELRSIPSTDSPNSANAYSNWAIDLFATVSRWTPVQDRFVILTTAMESLTSSAIVESAFQPQSNIVSIVASLLRSDINFIGLSALDVLLGLMQHALSLLQLHRHSSSASLPRQPLTSDKVRASETSLGGQGSILTSVQSAKEPSSTRIQLLEQLKDCIGDLATHVYYSDQISDMLSALMSRLKPSSGRAHGSTVTAAEDANKSPEAIGEVNNQQEKMLPDGYFSFDTARLLALQAMRRILVVANSQRANGHNAIGRSRVDVSVWEGSQWLLRDPEPFVRHAYIDAILTWLQLEVDKKHLRLVPEPNRQPKSKPKSREQGEGSLLAKRVLSNASQRLRSEARSRHSFLEVLHLAIYENALTYSDSEPDIIRLHNLLVNLVQCLGVNSVRSGLPMMFRLQDDIQYLEGPVSIISVASLVHGYFWITCRFFDFENTALGQEITGEIGRRSSKSLWLKSIRLPPLSLDSLESPDATTATSIALETGAHPGSLQMMNSRQEFVEHIATGYSLSVSSPPNSPPSSPQRAFSRPSVAPRTTTTSIPTVEKVLPIKVKEQMLEPWSKEACLAATESDLAQTTSISGSKSGSGSGKRSVGAGDGRGANGSPERTNQPFTSTGINLSKRPHNEFDTRMDSKLSGERQSIASVLRIQDLKRALSGNPDVIQLSSRQSQEVVDTASESMVTASISDSGDSRDFPREEPIPPLSTPPAQVRQSRSSSLQEPPPPTLSAASAGTWREADALQNPPPPDEDVPPVPMLPANLRATHVIAPVATELPKVTPSADPPPVSMRNPTSNDRPKSVGVKSSRQNFKALLAELDGLDIYPKRRVSAIDAPPY